MSGYPPIPDNLLQTLTLDGSGHDDTFSRAVTAAARLLGRDADYETVLALSTNAFAPVIQPGEDCMSW